MVPGMSVVEPIPAAQAPLLARPFYGGGEPGPIAATLAYVPELMELALPFIGATLSPSAVGFRTKEIVILRTSCVMGCRYCIDSHTPVALDSGLSDAQVRALRGEPGHELAASFTDERDLALIAWTDAVGGGKGAVDDDTTKRMSTAFTDHEIVELTLLVGATLLLNRYATALRLPVGDETVGRLTTAGFERAA